MTLRELEIKYIAYVLEKTDYNRTQAAKILGIDRRTLYRWIHKYDLDDLKPAHIPSPVLGELIGEKLQ